MQLNDTLSLIVQGLLIIALPIVIAAAVQHLRAMSQQLRMKLTEEQRQSIDNAISTGVKFAEQTGIVQGLIGPEKKKQAIDIAQKFLAEKGIKLDLDKLSTLIEAEVATQFKNPTAPVDSPEARQQLIDQALQTAVQAAEQSGLTGLIQNLGPEKKAYAVQLAMRYLGQLNIKADPQVVGGLIESKLLKTGIPAAPAPVAPMPPAQVMPVQPPAPAPVVYAPPPVQVPPPQAPLAPAPVVYAPPPAQVLPLQTPAGGDDGPAG